MNENTQYWINQNGIQTGPHTIEQLKEMEITGNAYVWCAGMDDWKPVAAVPTLANLITAPQEPVEAPQEQPMAATSPAVAIPPIPQEPQQAMQPATAPEQAVQQPYQPQQAAEMPKCPPTNLVWAILSTILCCLPLGIVAIIYSVKVTQKYQQGDIKAAEHYSEVSAWWCIGTIIGGIVLSPFVSLIQMAIMG